MNSLQNLNLLRIRQWIQKLSLAVVEQGFFSGSTFVINVLLIRWFTVEAYGAYALAFAIFILTSSFYNAVILEPIVKFGPVKYDDNYRQYAHLQTILFLIVSLVISGLLMFVVIILALVNTSAELQQAFFGMTIANGALMSIWLLRRLYYARQRSGTIAAITAAYAILEVVALLLLHTLGLLNPFSAYVGQAVTTLGVGIVGLYFVGRSSTAIDPTLNIRVVWQENLQYGNWLIVSAVLYWFSNYAYFVMVGVVLSIEETGALRAIQNLTLPVVQFNIAMGLLFLPWASKQLADRGHAYFGKIIFAYMGFLTSNAGVYYLALVLFYNEVFDIVYAGQYIEYSALIPLLGLLPIMKAFVAPLSIGLRIGYGTRYIFLLDATSAIVIFTVSLYLTMTIGLRGTVIGMLVSDVVRFGAALWLWKISRQKAIRTQLES